VGKKTTPYIEPIIFNSVYPKNEKQKIFINLLEDNNKKYVISTGPAGSGKTYLAVNKAIEFFNKNKYNKIIITRPTVGTDETLGYLPGSIEDKLLPWMVPIMDIFKESFSKNHLDFLLKNENIEMAPLMYMRGRTFKNTYIIADELQNSTPNQMKLLLTRLGEYSKMVITGDLNQKDLKITDGLTDFLEKYKNKPSNYIGIVNFTKEDVERHPAIKDILHIYGEE
jgi:phosphate starvation-inducible PhoH-like protein